MGLGGAIPFASGDAVDASDGPACKLHMPYTHLFCSIVVGLGGIVKTFLIIPLSWMVRVAMPILYGIAYISTHRGPKTGRPMWCSCCKRLFCRGLWRFCRTAAVGITTHASSRPAIGHPSWRILSGNYPSTGIFRSARVFCSQANDFSIMGPAWPSHSMLSTPL